MFFDYNGIKIETKMSKNPQIFGSSMKGLNLWVKGEITREIRKYFELGDENTSKFVRKLS